VARITLPRLPTLPSARELIAKPWAGAAAAGGLLVTTVAVLLLSVGGMTGADGAAQVSLADAPKAWRAALRPAHGPMVISRDVVRLSEAPLGGTASHAQPTAATAPAPTAGPLPAAPTAGFYAQGPGGLLPIIAADGRTPFEVYKRPFVPNGRPRVALIVSGLGLDPRATQAAIDGLPAEVTLAFSPYADDLQAWVDKARQRGHEVLLAVPMEPLDYPDNDPGPYTLMARSSGADVAKKMEWTLSRATGYLGLTNAMGSRFLASDSAYAGFASALKLRGLAFIDDGLARSRGGGHGGPPRASAERIIDDQPARAAIDQQLLALESAAQQRGQALAAGRAYPITLATASHWAQGLEARGLQLAPASALVAH